MLTEMLVERGGFSISMNSRSTSTATNAGRFSSSSWASLSAWAISSVSGIVANFGMNKSPHRFCTKGTNTWLGCCPLAVSHRSIHARQPTSSCGNEPSLHAIAATATCRWQPEQLVSYIYASRQSIKYSRGVLVMMKSLRQLCFQH